jgi:hypothetical protein
MSRIHSQSSLTRAVFRALLADRPYAFADCGRHTINGPALQRYPAQRLQIQKRSIFGISIGATPRGLADAKNTPGNLEVALGHLVDLVRARRTQSKPPAQDQVADALRFLFRSHLEKPRRFSRNEIYLAVQAFKHLQELSVNQGGEESLALSREDLTYALQALARARSKDKFRSDTGVLAYSIFEQLQKFGETQGGMPSGGETLQDNTFATYVEVLSSTGRAREARDLLWGSSKTLHKGYIPTWVAVVKGLFNEGLEKEAWRTLEQIQDSIGLLDPVDQEQLVVFLAERNNILAAKRLYESKLDSDGSPTIPCILALIQLGIRKKDFEWSRQLVKAGLKAKGEAEVLNTLLLWYVAQEISTSNIERSLRNALKEIDVPETSLTMSNFNHLLDYAYSTRNPEAARKYMGVAEQASLRPDARTFLAQLAYQVDVGDLTAAKFTYDRLLSEDSLADGSDIPILNRFLTALCFSQKPEIETIMRVVDGLLDRGADLDAETAAGLCQVFLQRDEPEEAMGLLRHRADSYPSEDRARISTVFQKFILDPKVPDQRAFNAYELFRHAFPETPIDQRLALMNSFFNRNRSDLACQVFGHMRQREEIEFRPTSEAYAQCFEGIAKCRDVDGLQIVYNMLKMDREVDPTTRIRNGLMAAYTACQLPYTAIIDHFWKIMDSREGPTLSSFALALRACETWVPQGSQEARRIIALMQSWGFEISKEIYHCYIGALAGQCEFENTIELIEEMEGDIGEKPDVITIGTFYNAIPWQYRKDEVESWAKQAYPELWEELVAQGDEIDEEWEVRYFKIDRSIDINDELLFGDGEYDPQIAHASQITLEAPLK